VICSWSYELILFLYSTKKLQILCLKYQVLSYKIYSPGRPCARMHYGALFVLNVVSIEVKAMNLLGCHTACRQISIRLQHVGKFTLGYNMLANFH